MKLAQRCNILAQIGLVTFCGGEFMTKKEKEAYEWFLDRISEPTCPVLVSKEEQDEYNRMHPLPTREEIDKVLKDAGYFDNCKDTTMTDKEYEEALKDREAALLNEEFKPRKLTPEEIEELKRKGRI